MYDQLKTKIKVLNELMWEKHIHWSDVERWLANFAAAPDKGFSEQLHALFLLSHFSYFNSHSMRILLQSLFRDLVQYPVIVDLRRRHTDTLNWSLLEPLYQEALAGIRFIGMGNPSESGTHLLYYFRQENKLPQSLFVYPDELFDSAAALSRLIGGLRHVVFLDDFCGSGLQATRYSKRHLRRIRELDGTIKLSYYPLFATTEGLDNVRRNTLFTDVETVCELDRSFRALEVGSRYFREALENISREFAAEMCRRYGVLIEPDDPVGFGESQLLLGFAHNIPNNSLPILWSEGHTTNPWTPIFPRHTKEAGW